MTGDLHGESLKVGLKINEKTTKIMFKNHKVGRQAMTVNEALEQMEEYTYLEQTVIANAVNKKETKRRIGMGWSAFGKQS